MKKILLMAAAMFLVIVCYGQDPEIQRLIKKMQSGQQLTEAEQAKMEEWADNMEKQYSGNNKPSGNTAIKTTTSAKGNLCPATLKTVPQVTALTRESYIALAKTLMTTYGQKLGSSLPDVKRVLESAATPSDGADIGALFIMAGAGSATIYCTAWSAAQLPDDILTANTLGVALKDMGEYVKALQVLLYADKLRPDIPLVLINTGWVYREMGNPAAARKAFEKALAIDPGLTAPHLGLGLIAECQGDHFTAEKHLRIALAEKYSVAGFGAYKNAKEAKATGNNDSGSSSGNEQPLPDDRGGSQGFEIPDLPVYPDPMRMKEQVTPLQSYLDRLDRRLASLIDEFMSTARVVAQQTARANLNPEGSVVFSRDFATEKMMFEDASVLLFGPASNFGMALAQGATGCAKAIDQVQSDFEAFTRDIEEMNRISEELNRCTEKYVNDLAACGDNEACQKKVEAEYDACAGSCRERMDEISYRICKRSKNDLDILLACNYKLYSKTSSAFRNAASDYYAFTDPVLARIYAPSYNELLNLWREITVLTFQKSLAGMATSLADASKGYDDLKCIEPQPSQPPEQAEDPVLPKKKKDDCPLGDGIKAGFGSISAELTCDHVSLSGGEGILGKISRDFKKHETTIWVGVGAKVEYGNGNLSGEATVGVEVTIGQGNTVSDVGLTSSVKTGLGGLVEAEISGRISVQGGPELTTSAGLTTPEFPGVIPSLQ